MEVADAWESGGWKIIHAKLATFYSTDGFTSDWEKFDKCFLLLQQFISCQLREDILSGDRQRLITRVL